MSRRTKIDFEPLSLKETAEQLGIPKKRAERILSFVDAEPVPASSSVRAIKRRTAKHRSALKSTRRRLDL